MFINKLIKAAAIGAGIYLVGKAGEAVGYCKGVVATVRTAGANPEWAVESAANFDRLEKEWRDLKNEA